MITRRASYASSLSNMTIRWVAALASRSVTLGSAAIRKPEPALVDETPRRPTGGYFPSSTNRAASDALRMSGSVTI